MGVVQRALGWGNNIYEGKRQVAKGIRGAVEGFPPPRCGVLLLC